MTSTFAERIRQAAIDFPGAHSTAWVQYLTEGNVVHVRMQAPEIMKEFRGNVKFGVGRSNHGPLCSLFVLSPEFFQIRRVFYFSEL